MVFLGILSRLYATCVAATMIRVGGAQRTCSPGLVSLDGE